MKILSIVMLLLFVMNSYAGTSLFTPVLSEQLNNVAELGKVQVEGVGEVTLIARRNKNQLIIHAQDAIGHVIGKAETLSGLKETPIYVLTDTGLKKIIIHWGVSKT